MASKQPSKSVSVSPQKADDFKLITGIGPANAVRLYEAGIHTFGQLASLSPTKLANRVEGLSAKQITRQDWIGQARKLNRKKPKPKNLKKETTVPILRQHYESFTVEFLQDENNTVRRLRVVHVQTGEADTWTGWEAKKLIDFLTQHIEARTTAAKFTDLEILESPERSQESVFGNSGPVDVNESNTAAQFSIKSKLTPSGNKITASGSQSKETTHLTGTLSVSDLKVVPFSSDIPLLSLHHEQPYLLRLTLDLSKVDVPSDTQLVYKANIVVKQLGGSGHLVHVTISNYKQNDEMTLIVLGPVLPPGLYHLAVFVTLTSDEVSSSLSAFLKGELLQVY